jgi:uncharacterized protein YggT (Ycf19 family)
MLTTLIIVKLIAEIALMALFGRWILGLLAGARREQNLFYQVLHIMARPFLWVARRITPRMVIDRHVPMVAFLLLSFVWLATTILKVQTCVQMGAQACR